MKLTAAEVVSPSKKIKLMILQRRVRTMNRLLAAALTILFLVCPSTPAYLAHALDYPLHAIKLVLPQPGQSTLLP
jgi:hypothetical protein